MVFLMARLAWVCICSPSLLLVLRAIKKHTNYVFVIIVEFFWFSVSFWYENFAMFATCFIVEIIAFILISMKSLRFERDFGVCFRVAYRLHCFCA